MRPFAILLCTLVTVGCVDEATELDPATDALRELQTVALAPTEQIASSTSVTSGSGAHAVGVFEGRAAIGTSMGLLASNTNAIDSLAPVHQLSADGGLSAVGDVTFVGRRGTQGTLVISDKGLFHSRSSVLLQAPLSESLTAHRVFTVDSFGEGADEQLWFLSDEGILNVSGGEVRTVRLTGIGAKPEAVLAAGDEGAYVVVDGSLYVISLTDNAATRIAKGVGIIASFERGDDGAAYFATDDGLLEVRREGPLFLHTFAAEGEQGRAITSVAAASGLVVASTGEDLFAVESSGSVRIGAHPGTLTRGVAIDSAGDTFAASPTSLRRFKTGKPASFENDVKPFFSSKCMSCHRAGVSGARVIDFEDYETAKAYAANALNRLNAVGVSPMPPANIETLSAADYAVVTRWVSGGMAP